MPFFESSHATRLFYKDWGAGKPFVFVPSVMLNSDMWQYQMLDLAEGGARCVAYDRRGHGRSDDAADGFAYDVLADDLAALIEHLDLRDVTLVGYSMGGGEIVRYLSRHGDERIAGAVFVSTTLPFMLETADNPDGLPPAVVGQLCDALVQDAPRWLAENRSSFFGEGLPGCSISPQLAQWLSDSCLQPSLLAVVACTRAAFETDFRAELPAIDRPALIVHGTADTSTPVELCARKAERLLPRSSLTLYEDAPHGLFLTHRQRLSEDLLAFGRQPRPGSPTRSTRPVARPRS